MREFCALRLKWIRTRTSRPTVPLFIVSLAVIWRKNLLPIRLCIGSLARLVRVFDYCHLIIFASIAVPGGCQFGLVAGHLAPFLLDSLLQLCYLQKLFNGFLAAFQ